MKIFLSCVSLIPLTAYIQGQFVDSYDPTIENTFQKVMKVSGQEYEVSVVDTAGSTLIPTAFVPAPARSSR